MKTFQYSPEVKEALVNNQPIVALESTVIAHGLPYPQNLETAKAMEDEVRRAGAVPATIAVLSGEPRIGLSNDELAHFATSGDIQKISIRDLPYVTSKGLDCATTVASTMFLANAVGIAVFATGGIGGVHRGGESDVSADLPVLASIPMTTVCAGAKIVLDLPATREWLETNGVCVIGWKTDDFPAFYSRKSGLDTDGRVDSAKDAAAVVRSRNSLGLKSALLVTVPVNGEDEIDSTLMENALANALVEASDQNINGKETTPFLLSRIAEYSGGQSIKSNIALLLNNARVAAQIAVELKS